MHGLRKWPSQGRVGSGVGPPVRRGRLADQPAPGLRELEKALPPDAMVSTDIGNISSVSNSYLRFERAPSFLAAMSFGNCGYAFPTGRREGGAARAPGHRLCGRRRLGMSLNEVLTVVREEIPW